MTHRILFVHPGAEFSIWDVGAGLRRALEAQGHTIADYYLTRRLMYHGAAMDAGGLDPDAENIAAVSKQASENVLIEALYHRADLVIIVSGLNLHPLALWLLDRVGDPHIPVAVVLTESPYEDPQQIEWLSAHRSPIVFTNDRASARLHGWSYLPHAFDPAVHYSRKPEPTEACDVLMVATGWRERQELFEQIDWSGIRLRLIGPWPYLPEAHPLRAFVEDRCVPNAELPQLYASAKICLNFFRRHLYAESLGPRTYELAACGAFQLSDDRAELEEIFNGTIPTFETAAQLEGMIRHFLAHDDERRELAGRAQAIVQGETFQRRAEQMMQVIESRAVRGAAPTLVAVS